MAAPARSNARGAVTRARILAAAVDCLTEGGIDDVRIAKVAERAATSSASVHYHFATRETLLAEAIEESFAVAGDVRTTTKYGAGGARERLRRKVEESLPLDPRRRREWELWVELWLRAVRHSELRPTAAKLYARMHQWFGETIAEGVESGEFTVADPGRTIDRLLALIDGYGIRALTDDPAMPIERAREEIWVAVAADLGVAEG